MITELDNLALEAELNRIDYFTPSIKPRKPEKELLDEMRRTASSKAILPIPTTKIASASQPKPVVKPQLKGQPRPEVEPQLELKLKSGAQLGSTRDMASLLARFNMGLKISEENFPLRTMPVGQIKELKLELTIKPIEPDALPPAIASVAPPPSHPVAIVSISPASRFNFRGFVTGNVSEFVLGTAAGLLVKSAFVLAAAHVTAPVWAIAVTAAGCFGAVKRIHRTYASKGRRTQTGRNSILIEAAKGFAACAAGTAFIGIMATNALIPRFFQPRQEKTINVQVQPPQSGAAQPPNLGGARETITGAPVRTPHALHVAHLPSPKPGMEIQAQNAVSSLRADIAEALDRHLLDDNKAIRQLAENARGTQNIYRLQHDAKEVSYDLNQHEAARQLGVNIVRDGREITEAFGLRDPNSEKLMRDDGVITLMLVKRFGWPAAELR